MKRLGFFIILFFVLLCIPLGYFIFKTHQSLDQEEMAELRYFADTLFYEMEKELAAFVRKEEARDIDDYTGGSELSEIPEENYILGYFQNNPDGSFQTPMAIEGSDKSKTRSKGEGTRIRAVVRELEADNRIFNTKRAQAVHPIEVTPPEKMIPEKEADYSLAGKYLNLSRTKQQQTVLGQAEKKVKEIPAWQVSNLDRQERPETAAGRSSTPAPAARSALREKSDKVFADGSTDAGIQSETEIPAPPGPDRTAGKARDNEPAAVLYSGESVDPMAAEPPADATFQVAVDPLQSVLLSDNKIVLFRRIVIDNRMYRQGVVIRANEFLSHLAAVHFENQPMAKFTRLSLSLFDQGKERTVIQTGAGAEKPKFTLNRNFPRPFSLLRANLACQRIPRSDGRKTLTLMMTVMGAIILVGFMAIFQSVRSIVETSERRSRFVSSVTHELKTPLTNIRMYVEMLEQGIAPNPEREQDYFKVLGSESSRLSRLISNVLEFSRLEKKNHRLDLSAGTFETVIAEVKGVMGEKLRQEGFVLDVRQKDVAPFMYDRDAMVQVLINLIDNSIKFGKKEPEKRITLTLAPEAGYIRISLADTGPGIPPKALKKVFDDFYRGDTETARTTGGTGIGLALVRRLINAMGGRVTAENNNGPGCTISMFLPQKKNP